MLIGSGKLENSLKEFLKKKKINFKISKSIKNTFLSKYLNQSKIFLSTSLYEGNPKSLLEALSCELIAISTKFSGVSDIINNKINGYITNYDSKEIENKILYVLKNYSKLSKISINGRKYVLLNNEINLVFKSEYREIFK